MVLLITDIPTPDLQMCRTITTECQVNTPPKKRTTEKGDESYFLLTELNQKTSVPDYLTINDLFKTEPINYNTFNAIYLSNLMFGNSKQLVGRELEVLNKTFKRLLSKTPTKL